MTNDNKREFVVTEAALREDLAACTGFIRRIRAIVATSLG